MPRPLAPLGLLLLGLSSIMTGPTGCVSNTIILEDDGVAMSDSTGPSTTTAPNDGDGDGDGDVTTLAVTTNTDPLDDGETADEPPGYCAMSCEQSSDCGSLEDFACIDGICDYIGELFECDPSMCDDLGFGQCTMVEGLSVCAFPCVQGTSDCDPFVMECIGIDDAGNTICASPPCFGAGEGEVCAIDGFGAFGTCVDGECTCTSDDECTVDGLVCNV